MLTSILSKKYLNEESNAPGSNLAVKKAKIERKPKEAPTTTILSISDLEGDDESVVEEDHLKELEELMCVVCKLMDVSARNRLVECSDCHSLYHQQCHKPQISESDANDQENSWYCSSCKGKATKSSSTNSSPAKSSSSSNYESSSSSRKSSNKNKVKSSSESDRKHH